MHIVDRADFERAIREAAQLLLHENPHWGQLSTQGKLNLAMQIAMRKKLESDQGQVAPTVTSAVMCVAEKYRDDIITQALDRAWEAYSRP